MTRMILNRFYARTFAYSILVATFYLVNIGCDDLEYDQRESSSDTGCHDYTQIIDSLDRKHGSISSPNFQSSCPLDVVRRYHFKGTPEERVQLAFTEMRMEVEEQDGSSNCEHGDYIKVSVLLKKTMREIDTYCGIKQPPTLMSSENEMEVNYVRRSSTNKPGVAFTANYSFVTDFGIRSGIQVKTNPNIACMFEYHSDRSSNGTFTSPNYPGLYPRNTECHYIFHGKPNERIYIHFIYFDVEGNQLCSDESQSDYVELSNFNIPLIDRKMLRLCGLKPANKNEVNSDGDFFRVTFKSNDIYDSTGFQAFYQFRQTKAEQFMLPKKERISSTGSSISLNFPGILSYFCFVCYNIIVVPLI